MALLDSPDSFHPAARVLAWIDARRWWLFALAAAMHLASFSGVWRVGPDSATYLAAARNLFEGQGLVVNESAYTHGFAGFPTLLAYTQRLFGSMIFPGVAIVHAAGLASLLLVFLLIRRHAGRPLAVLIAFLFAVNAVLLRHCAELLADVPFLLGVAATLLGYELTYRRGTDHAAGRVALAAGLIAAGVALMASMRIVVVVVLAALAVDLLWRHRHGRAKWAALGMCLSGVAIAAVVRLADPRMRDGFHLLPKEKYLLESVTNLGMRAERIVDFTFVELMLRVTPTAILGNRVGIWPLDLLIALFVFVSGAALLRRRVAWGVLVVLCFVQWLLFFPDTRYFLPVLPLLLLGWWDAAVSIAGRLSRPRGGLLLGATVALLAIPNLLRDLGFIVEQRRTPFLHRYQEGRYLGVPELGAKIDSTLPADLVIIADEKHAGPLHYWSRRRTITLIEGRDLQPIPEGRTLAILLPAGDALRAAVAAHALEIGDVILTDPGAGPESAAIATLRQR